MSGFSLRLLSVFLFFSLTVAFGTSTKSTVEGNEVTITIASPNITIVQGNKFTCKTIDIPKGKYMLSRIVPKPVPGIHYHMVVTLCDKSFGQNQESGWECSPVHDEKSVPRLHRLPYCSPSSGVDEFTHFVYQFQAGSVDEGSLILPQGTGVPVGDDSDYRSIVALFHFFQPQDLVNGSTAGSAIDVTLTPLTPQTPVLPVSSLVIEAIGFVGGKSVGTVTGTWTMKDTSEMMILSLFTHWHEVHSTAVNFEVTIERKSGGRDVILRQDPHAFAGITDVSYMTSAVVREGDRLQIRCTYNNTSDRTLRIEVDDMCLVMAYYTLGGEKPLVETNVFSADPVYKKCIPDPMFNRSSWQFNYEGRSSYQGATGDDCFVPFPYSLH